MGVPILGRDARQRRFDRDVAKMASGLASPVTPEMLGWAVRAALDPTLPVADPQVGLMADQLVKATSWPSVGGNPNGGVRNAPRPVSVAQVAQRASRALGPQVSTTPGDIEAALRFQGLDWLEPFAPGRPLVPYYGYGRRPRGFDFQVGANITGQARADRLPFATLKQIFEGYDIAMICARHIINDVRSMKLELRAMEGFEGDVKAEIAEARRFLRYPDGRRPWESWLARWAMDVFRYDAGCLYRQRNKGGRVTALKVVDGSTIAPMLDYFGDVPEPPAPAFQQFIQGVPWDWLTTDDLIYQPQWPIPESPYGVAPLETILINANTDVRLQMFFLEFFTAGAVPEMLMEAPPEESDPDALAEWQETWDDWYQGNQAGRHGARWIPSGSKPFIYKPQEFDPKLAEYVMRRTVAAFGLVPNDLGFTDQVNRATSDTQVDVQFRVSTLPNTQYFEALLDGVLQDDLSLPVATHFDTGREKEDRLMEAQAHQIYVSIGAESPDEVRGGILDLPVDNQNMVPRFFDSQRLGPIPIEYLVSVSGGHIDPQTLIPKPGTVQQMPFVSAYGLKGDVSEAPSDTAAALPGGHSNPSVPSPTTGLTHPGPGVAGASSSSSGGARSAGRPAARKSADLSRWRSNARSRVAKGRPPRGFDGGDIPPDVYEMVWGDLSGASTREGVDAAFAKGEELLKAGGGPSPSPKAPRPGPGGAQEPVLVAQYAPQVQAALAAQVSPAQVAAQWAAMAGAGLAAGAAGGFGAAAGLVTGFVTTVQVVASGLLGVLTAMGAAAWAAAVAASAWPGPDPMPGFDEYRSRIAALVADISETTRERIRQVIEQSVAEGWSEQQTAAAIGATLDDPARAALIARTEVNRAMTMALAAVYERQGHVMFDLLTEPDCCPICADIRDRNPHPLGDVADMSPIHPDCRCSIAPFVEE